MIILIRFKTKQEDILRSNSIMKSCHWFEMHQPLNTPGLFAHVVDMHTKSERTPFPEAQRHVVVAS